MNVLLVLRLQKSILLKITCLVLQTRGHILNSIPPTNLEMTRKSILTCALSITIYAKERSTRICRCRFIDIDWCWLPFHQFALIYVNSGDKANDKVSRSLFDFLTSTNRSQRLLLSPPLFPKVCLYKRWLSRVRLIIHHTWHLHLFTCHLGLARPCNNREVEKLKSN